jgi:hypothetical protein
VITTPWSRGRLPGFLSPRQPRTRSFGHVEAASILAGHHGQHALSAAATLNLSRRVRFVTQEYWSKRAAYQALGVVPANVDGGSTIEGCEVTAARHIELYS